MISMIASVGKNRELGKKNGLVWRISADMKYFKKTTMGHKVIMGYNTYKSLPGDLPGREIIVIDRNCQQIYFSQEHKKTPSGSSRTAFFPVRKALILRDRLCSPPLPSPGLCPCP